MRRCAKECLLSAALLGAMLAASAPVAADEVTVPNELTVAPSAPSVQPVTGKNTEHSDAKLAKAVRGSFRTHWATSRVADRIRVGVEDGVATLTGDLDTWDQRLEAGSVALGTEGVRKVQNQLTVKGYDYEWEELEYEAPSYYEEPFPNVG